MIIRYFSFEITMPVSRFFKPGEIDKLSIDDIERKGKMAFVRARTQFSTLLGAEVIREFHKVTQKIPTVISIAHIRFDNPRHVLQSHAHYLAEVKAEKSAAREFILSWYGADDYIDGEKNCFDLDVKPMNHVIEKSNNAAS